EQRQPDRGRPQVLVRVEPAQHRIGRDALVEPRHEPLERRPPAHRLVRGLLAGRRPVVRHRVILPEADHPPGGSGLASRGADIAPVTPPSQVARRDVVRVAIVGAAVAASGAVSSAASPPAAASGPVLTTSTNLHLLRRLTYGPSPASVADIQSLGPQGWLRAQ